MMQRIEKTELAQRLDAVLGEPVGMAGLNILLYGWRKFRHWGALYCDAIKHRTWLYITEVHDFSDYIGYDLSKREFTPFLEGE